MLILVNEGISPTVYRLELANWLEAFRCLVELRLSVVQHTELFFKVWLVVLVSIFVCHEKFVSFLLCVECIGEAI